METLSIVLVTLLAGLAYLLPIAIATYRDHHRKFGITVLVLTFGWSGVGWLVALGWSLLPVRRSSTHL